MEENKISDNSTFKQYFINKDNTERLMYTAGTDPELPKRSIASPVT